MFFYLSKILSPLLELSNLLVILLCVGVVLQWTRWRRAGRWLVAAGALFALLVAVVPIGDWMTTKLENRFPALALLPDKVDGVIVLGGVIDQLISQDRGSIAIGGGVGRLIAFGEVARRYPAAKLIFSGGSGRLRRQEIKEAAFIKPFFEKIGLPADRVLIDGRARNTAENAVYGKAVANPEEGEVWLLITSALHMPRAVGAFRNVGWDVIPYPVDYVTSGRGGLGLRFHLAAGFGQLSRSLHEVVGLVAYRLTGRTQTFWPQPEGLSGK